MIKLIHHVTGLLVLITIEPSDPRPIYVQIMDEIRRARVLGTLAAELRVNPNTVSQAYRELERDGVVYVRRGQGTFLSAAQANGAARRVLARGVAERALRDAHRHGIGGDELIDTIPEVMETGIEEERA
jgi:GntR family transcriptional regulator